MVINKKAIVALAGSGLLGLSLVGSTVLAASPNHHFWQHRHQARLEARLDQAVKNGKITQAQEAQILAELKRLRTEHRTDIRTDRQAEKQKLQSELSQWAQANGINLKDLL